MSSSQYVTVQTPVNVCLNCCCCNAQVSYPRPQSTASGQTNDTGQSHADMVTVLCCHSSSRRVAFQGALCHSSILWKAS